MEPLMPEGNILCRLSFILSISVLAVIIGGLWNRIVTKKGIGWQFIRYTVIAITIPITAILALNNMLTGEITTLFGLALGYAFGKSGKDE